MSYVTSCEFAWYGAPECVLAVGVDSLGRYWEETNQTKRVCILLDACCWDPSKVWMLWLKVQLCIIIERSFHAGEMGSMMSVSWDGGRSTTTDMLEQSGIDVAGERWKRVVASRELWLTRWVAVMGTRCLFRKNIRFDLKVILLL